MRLYNPTLMRTQKLLALLFPGFEEMEAFITVDMLRRANIEIVTACTSNALEVCGAHAIQCKADQRLEDIHLEDFDGVFIPGGSGVFSQNNETVLNVIRYFYNANKWIAAICAAPILLKAAGCLPKNFTAHACVADQLTGCNNTLNVVTDGHIITSRGPGTAFPFAFELIQRLTTEEVVLKLKSDIHYEK